MANLYQIMELAPFSSLERVKKQYKTLAFKYHPDAHRGEPLYEDKFKMITRAYGVLSDPKKKLSYDQVLYNSLVLPKKPRVSRSTRPSPPVYQRKRTKQGKWQTSFIILLVFGAGFMIYNIIWQTNNYLTSKENEQRMVARNALLERARFEYSNGNYKQALNYLDMIKFDQTGADLVQMRKQLIEDSEREASKLMKASNYADAMDLLSMLIRKAHKVKEEWYIGLAVCYKKLGNVNYAIELLENLLEKNPELLLANKEIAFIFQNDLGDLDQALFYLERATALIVNNYVNHYGKAYYVVINPENHPPSDFNVFIEKARIYSAHQRFEEAISACKWASVLNPDSPDPHLLIGSCYFDLGNYKEACKAISSAKEKGAEIPEELQKINC